MMFGPEIVRTVKSVSGTQRGELIVGFNGCKHTISYMLALGREESLPDIGDSVRCFHCEAEARRGMAQLSDRGQAGNLFLYAVTLQGHEFGLCIIQRRAYNAPHWYAYMINGIMSGRSYDRANVAVAAAVKRIEENPLSYIDQ